MPDACRGDPIWHRNHEKKVAKMGPKREPKNDTEKGVGNELQMMTFGCRFGIILATENRPEKGTENGRPHGGGYTLWSGGTGRPPPKPDFSGRFSGRDRILPF